MDTSAMEQTLALYRQLAHLGDEIEKNILARQFDQVQPLTERLQALQAMVQENDRRFNGRLAASSSHIQEPQVKELLALMGAIQDRNARLLPQLHSVMALQGNDLHKMRQGNVMLQGYTQTTRQTGGRIASAG
jgi:hypothetical protein